MPLIERVKNKSLLVIVRQGSREEEKGLEIVQEIVAKDIPITIAYETERILTWLQREDEFYASLRKITDAPAVDVAQIGREVIPLRKKPRMYCPKDGRYSWSDLISASERSIQKLVVPGEISASPYRLKEWQIDVVTVTPFENGGNHRYVHAAEIAERESGVREFCKTGLQRIAEREKAHWIPAKWVNYARRGINHLFAYETKTQW